MGSRGTNMRSTESKEGTPTAHCPFLPPASRGGLTGSPPHLAHARSDRRSKGQQRVNNRDTPVESLGGSGGSVHMEARVL